MANKTLVKVTKDNAITVSFKNAQLTEQVNKIVSAYAMEGKAQWKKAEACYEVINNNLWAKDKDFETEQDFAKFVKVSPAQLSAYKTAVTFIRKHEDLVERSEKTGDILNGIFMSKAEILGRIKDYEGFNKWCIENYKGEAHTFGDNSLKKLIKIYEAPVIEAKETEQEETEQEKTEK